MAGYLKHPMLAPLRRRAIEDHHVSLSWDVFIFIAHLRSFWDHGPYPGNHQPG